MVQDQKERRGNEGNRRKMKLWVLLSWVAVVVLTHSLSAGTGFFIGNDAPTLEEMANTYPDETLAIAALTAQLDSLVARPPEVRTVVTQRIVRDTVYVPTVDIVYAEPQVYTMYDTVRSVRVDTFYMPPNIIRIPAPPRTFWSSETYKPSIGNTAWAVGGGILGYLLRGAIDNSATSCIVINGDQACEF